MSVGDNVTIAIANDLGVDRKVSVMAGDLAALKHDVNVVKCEVAHWLQVKNGNNFSWGTGYTVVLSEYQCSAV